METQEIKKEQELNKNAEKQTETQAQEGTHFEHVKETLELLYKTFQSFVKDGEARPLKIGIFEDLKEKCASVEGLSISKVRAALRLYTSRLKYLYSVKEGAPRIDIDGNECGDTVSAEHATYAKERIDEINAKRKASKPQKAPVNKKNFKKPVNGAKFHKKPNKVDGIKPTVEDLKTGTEVLVLSSEQRFVFGVVAEMLRRHCICNLKIRSYCKSST